MSEFLPTPQTVEERINEEESRLSRLSPSTLRYMHDYGVAWESWLRHHRGMLRFLAEETHDLFEAMHLSSRLTRVNGNIERTKKRNEEIRAHILRRQMDD